MIQYTDLFTPHHIATLVDWFQEKGSLFVQIELPHSGGSGLYETVHSLAKLKRTLEQISHPEIEIMIWRTRTQAEFDSDSPSPDDLTWIYTHPDDVMYFCLKKNRNSSASYTANPARYKTQIEDWSS